MADTHWRPTYREAVRGLEWLSKQPLTKEQSDDNQYRYNDPNNRMDNPNHMAHLPLVK